MHLAIGTDLAASAKLWFASSKHHATSEVSCVGAIRNPAQWSVDTLHIRKH